MAVKLIYATNVDRRYFMMNRAMKSLQQEGLLAEECRTIKIADGDSFGTYVSAFEGASLVMIKFMGNTIRTKFWQQCLAFLEGRGFLITWMPPVRRRRSAGGGLEKRKSGPLRSTVSMEDWKITGTCGSMALLFLTLQQESRRGLLRSVGQDCIIRV